MDDSEISKTLPMFYITAFTGYGLAEDLGIKLVVNPSKTDVPLGSEPIALTA